MKKLCSIAILTVIMALSVIIALASDSHNQVKLNIAPGGMVNIVNNSGSVTLHPGSQQQVTVNATTHSDKVEVDSNSIPDGKRVEIRTHVLAQQKLSNDELKVDYDITVPAGVSVTVSTATAPITIENLNANLSLSSDMGKITVKNAANAHIHVRSVAAPVALTNVTASYVEITSSSGAVQLEDVFGPKVTAGTTGGDITYRGDCSGGGVYSLTTHSGTIDVTLPQNASVDLTARSVTGYVENDFPFQQKSHPTFVPSPGRSLVGTSNSGSSSVELQSFSGRIRVKKQ